jgi:hypothetical protein
VCAVCAALCCIAELCCIASRDVAIYRIRYRVQHQAPISGHHMAIHHKVLHRVALHHGFGRHRGLHHSTCAYMGCIVALCCIASRDIALYGMLYSVQHQAPISAWPDITKYHIGWHCTAALRGIPGYVVPHIEVWHHAIPHATPPIQVRWHAVMHWGLGKLWAVAIGPIGPNFKRIGQTKRKL